MRKTLLLIAMMTANIAIGAVTKEPTVKRLDGSTIAPAEIDATVTRLMRAAEVTGVSIAILNDGKIAYLKSYGVADKEKSLPLTEDSVMTAASFTKVAFAYLVMQLVDEKILDLDQKPIIDILVVIKHIKRIETINGVFDEVGPTLREARQVIDETAPNAKSYKARLIDFNNDPTTTLADIQKLLQLVEDRLAKRLAEGPAGPK
jgi:hypothetical protein